MRTLDGETVLHLRIVREANDAARDERCRCGGEGEEEGASLGELAPRLGDQSEAAFSRAFKRFIGVSPGAARRSADMPPRKIGAYKMDLTLLLIVVRCCFASWSFGEAGNRRLWRITFHAGSSAKCLHR